jgi:hypothetical protein
LLRELLGHALAYTLAGLDEPSREVIHAHAYAFDRWARNEVVLRPSRFLRSEQPLQHERAAQASVSVRAVRGCVAGDALLDAIRLRVALLEPHGKPAVVLLAPDTIAPGLRDLLRRAQIEVREGLGGAQVPTLSTAAEQRWLSTVLREAKASAAVMATVTESGGMVKVELRCADATGHETAQRSFSVRVATEPGVPGGRTLAAIWSGGYPEDVERWLLTSLAPGSLAPARGTGAGAPP